MIDPDYVLPSGTNAKRVAKDVFWGQVGEITDTGCREWQGKRYRTDYGCFMYQGRYIQAHRLAYFLAKGVDPGKLCVCHKCDNPPCVNPDHLFLGTQKDNSQDKVSKGRSNTARGENAGNAKLTADDVRAIRELQKSGMLRRELAERFGVSQKQITVIVNRKQWAHIP